MWHYIFALRKTRPLILLDLRDKKGRFRDASVEDGLDEELKKGLLEELERGLDEARSCPYEFGALERILERTHDRLGRLVRQGLTEAASQEADFSPSGLPALRADDDGEPGPEDAPGPDDAR